MTKKMRGVRHYGTRKMAADFHRLGVRISQRTIQRATHRTPLRGFVLQRRPFLTPAMEKKRLAFAKFYLHQDPREVVFVDEKSYNGYFVQNRHNDIVYAFKRSEVQFARTVKYPPFIKAVFFMSLKRLSKPFFYTGKLSAALYQQALVASELVTKPKSYCQYGNVMLFQDGDSSHTAKSTREFLEQHGIRVVPKDVWPPNSPDLNPIENLQSWLGDKVCEQDPKSVAAVRHAAADAAASVPRSLLKSLIESFPNRLRNVIKAKGAYTKKY